MNSDRLNSVHASGRSYQKRKNHGKVPKKVHKAEREKLKRDHMNELFLDLAKVLDLDHPNNGKASILKDAIRLVGELLSQVEHLHKENKALLVESNYVTAEKQELIDDNDALCAQINTMQNDIEARLNSSNADARCQGSNTALCQPEEHVESAPTHVVGPVYIMPLHHDSQAYSSSCTEVITPPVLSNVSRPCPRYPTSSYSWPSHILTKQNE